MTVVETTPARYADFGPKNPGFNNVLLSEPVPLPFENDYSQVRVVYNLGRIMSWHMHSREVLGDVIERERALNRERDAAAGAFDDEWDEMVQETDSDVPLKRRFKYPAEFAAASDHWDDVVAPSYNRRRDEILRDATLRKINYLVYRLECWPHGATKAAEWIWSNTPQPNPHIPESLGVFDWAVWEWIVAMGTLASVEGQLSTPKKTMTPETRSR
jgi:hypothetical protein